MTDRDINDELVWKIINSHFNENPQSLVAHHIESYNDFYANGIQQIFKEKNPVRISSKYDETINDYRYQCLLYFGGKDGSRIYYGKPVIHDRDNAHYMIPNEARMRNMNYSMTIHYDIEVEYVRLLEPGEEPILVGVDELLHKTGGDGLELVPDYTDLTASHKLRESSGKLKKEGLTGGELQESLDKMAENSESDSDDEPVQIGGGPKKTTGATKATGAAPKGSKRPKSTKTQPKEKSATELPFILTAADAAKLREVNARSIVQPNKQIHSTILEKIYLGKFPIMVQSEYCILNGLNRDVRFSMGECRNDLGGYFIINGKEKTIVPQEKFADNMLYIKDVNGDDFLYSAEIRSVSENSAKPIRTFSVKMVAPDTKHSNRNLVVNIPNVRKPVPLFIVFRALGIISDKDIITMCLLDLEKYENMVDLFIPSVHDAGGVLSQQTALMYIASLTKINTVTYVLEILADYFLPHIGEVAYIQKAYYLGYIVFRLLNVSIGVEVPTDRDSFRYKRVELAGSLLHDLFKEYYSIQQRSIHLEFEKKLYYNKELYETRLDALIQDNYREIMKERILETGFKKAFKGNWGAQSHTKRIGIVQDLNRLSFYTYISHLRKTNLPLPSGVKLVGPRVLHSSHWGFIDPIDTPDGGNIGLHKQLAITTYISRGMSREPMIQWMRENASMRLVEDCGPQLLSQMTKIIINGYWAGAVGEPIETVKKIRLFRRNALLPIHVSATFDIKQNTIFIYTDMGRLCRPVFYKDENTEKMSYENKAIISKIKKGEFSWQDLISGFNEKKIANFNPNIPKIYELHELYEDIAVETNPAKLERFLTEKAIIDYIDPSESEDVLIAVSPDDVLPIHTHSEIHESLIFGVMCNQIIFPENNPPVRNSFSTGQSKQAVSMYHTNFPVRMDKTAVLLNSGQIPLVKSRFMEHINHEENTYGENAIVAVMCYTGYNVEDAILINEGALKRGLFRTTYYTTYEAHEETTKTAEFISEKKFSNIEGIENIVGKKPGYDYSKLDAYGIIRENTPVDDKTVLIGLSSNNPQKTNVRIDSSKTPKKGQIGIVDKTFITEGEEGERIAKVRIREERIPFLGDKMASRAGQKGTIGMVIPECDMPFTKEGIRPDLIINPHAIPTRMTIGQLVECIIGKASTYYGAFSDCTAFVNKGSKIEIYEQILAKAGFHSQGNEVLYNGMTGDQIETSVFIGPTYYMRLKHMVKDKVNFRARGPNTALTHQPVSGRANDGGLRIGEMERDAVISHGISNFLQESMMERGDKYHIAVCNQSGMIAIYNQEKNLFMSPAIDGPLQFTSAADGNSLFLTDITRFGRSFSIVSIPYTFKLLMQELQTINLQLRIITEDNIDQLENMSYSKNISKLLMNPAANESNVSEIIRQEINKRNREKTGNVSNYLESISPIIPVKDSSDNTQSPKYPDVSPAYEPTSAEMETLMLNATSPAYVPTSPAYEDREQTADEKMKADMKIWEEWRKYWDPETQSMTHRYDEATKTWIKNQLFEEIWDLKGGSSRPDFKVGEPVYLRGGEGEPNTIWAIKHIGDKFITVENPNPNYSGGDDTIQVVGRHELIRPHEINMANDREGLSFDKPMFNQMGGRERIPSHSNGTNNDGKIVFAPQIVVTTGNDNTTTIPTPSSNTSDMSQDEQGPEAITGEPSVIRNISMASPEPVKMDSALEPAPKPSSESSFSGGGLLDFAKGFFIKKMA
uniref:DNA-directed RNA polymerase n=1 Tax=viral metagenome TaxID=1070528 RepID=A0A6C0HIP2_9ZZZZ